MNHIAMNKKEIEEQLLTDLFPSVLQYKLGMWYKSRGLHTEALESLKKSLHDSNQPISNFLFDEEFDKSLVWLEYGKINKWVGNQSEAISAYQQCLKSGKHKLDGLVEWGDLLHSMGKQDSDIAAILQKKCTEYKLNSMLLAKALFIIGCYKEAFTLYSSVTFLSNNDYLQYIQCCLHLGEFTQALHLLESRLEQLIHLEIHIGSFTTALETLLSLCQWLTSDRQSQTIQTRKQQLEMAKLAICHGMPDEFMSIIPNANEEELSQIICILYSQGYCLKAKERLSILPLLPLNIKEEHCQNLCFIAAEIKYDEGKLQSAAEHFEQIYMNDITHTPSQFATAACYLQITLESLLSRIEDHPHQDDSTELTEQYIHNINQSLHIIHHTNWHTVWGTAERRRIST